MNLNGSDVCTFQDVIRDFYSRRSRIIPMWSYDYETSSRVYNTFTVGGMLATHMPVHMSTVSN